MLLGRESTKGRNLATIPEDFKTGFYKGTMKQDRLTRPFVESLLLGYPTLTKDPSTKSLHARRINYREENFEL